jgi:hypothetical protein
VSGKTYGRAATGLQGDISWAANAGTARAGSAGEKRTALVLDEIARTTEATVLHDVRIPIPGMRINIDHVVIAGTTVLLIDSKNWAPGFLWTISGKTYRGLRRFAGPDGKPVAEKRTVLMASEHIGGYVAGLGATFATPVVVVWPSRQGSLSLWAASFPGARLIHGHKLERVVRRSVPTKKPANPVIVARLRQLVR